MTKAVGVNLSLLLVALIWGAGFIPQKFGLDYFSPAAFNAWRFAFGALTLVPVMMLMRAPSMADCTKASTLLFGAMVGALLFMGALLQQISLQYTSLANVAFITGLYAIIVPIIGFFLGMRYSIVVWCGGFIAIFGLYLMTQGAGQESLKGDLIAFIGAIFWAIHLLVLAKPWGKPNQLALAFYQFLFCAIFSAALTLAMSDSLIIADFTGYRWAILNGVVVVGIAYTLQVVMMPKAEPFAASLILSLEAVFGAIAGYLIFDESKELGALIGAGLMLIGCLLAQRDDYKA